jgi:hypothetical protein
MTDVDVTVHPVAPLGGAMNDGARLVRLEATSKAAQNDTITVSNCSTVLLAFLQIVATGAAEAHTISNNIITCTSATTGEVKGLLLIR